MMVEGLKQFITSQGSSCSIVPMDWDKLWAINYTYIDPVALYYTALNKKDLVDVKNASIGNKNVYYSQNILIEHDDAILLNENEIITLINWEILKLKDISTTESIETETQPDNKDYKKTVKLTWLAKTSQANFTPTKCVRFDNIMTKPSLEKDNKTFKFVNCSSKSKICRKEFQEFNIPIPEHSGEAIALKTEVNEQGTTVRTLKSDNVSKDKIDQAVKVLLNLKA
ncbi:unnamed protein product [Didymodactylos carnosus]|uniref:WHEP-TRS domain-containing protein n=1 Tax=Didymodactylos carnosus TaxID=1234261 RepID=A0A815GFV8_9BILA|nr:unnamed protein product [Didymodactylos carnosus]CAF4198865.1 unnamed protein product [Didymodactylos carnosus]